MTWARKVSSFREITAAKADPPPLSTGLLFGTSLKELADPYDLYPDWNGQGKSPEEEEPRWRYKHTALKRECALCPGVECYRLLPCCACEHWTYLECSYGIPEGRLCASHCQILDPLRGVVVQCGPNELRCLVPWRPWRRSSSRNGGQGQRDIGLCTIYCQTLRWKSIRSLEQVSCGRGCMEHPQASDLKKEGR